MPKLALLTTYGGPIELAEFPLSTPQPGTAALKLRMAGICGSDTHIFRGELALPCPFAMGHEMVGEIAELGEGLTTDATGKPLAVGDRVVTPYFWFCGQCDACARGRSFLQHTSFPFGLMPEPFHLADINAAFASADAGMVPRGALVP